MSLARCWAALALLAAAPAAARPAPQQDELEQLPATPLPSAVDQLALARAAAARGDAAEGLSHYLRVLASQPDNVAALVGAGSAALAVGDVNAATGFFARAETRDARNGAAKAGLAATMLQTGDARAALRFFREATDLGVAPATIAGDRGLAYDLRGDTRRAQADYRLALATRADDETERRLAISQAIAGDRAAALATLDPQLRRQDRHAWRTRAFVRAMTGDVAGAEEDARSVMTPDQVGALHAYLVRLPGLKAADKAAAVHLGRFPSESGTRAPAPPRLAFDQAVTSAGTERLLRAQADARTSAEQQRQAAAPPPAAPPPPPPAATPTRADAAAAARSRRADAQSRQAKAKEAAEAKAERANPARHWVQVAGGANKKDLGKAWGDLRKKWPGQLAGRSPWTTHYRFTNRLLIGPFNSSDAAQDWVSARKAEGFATFRVETNAGDTVERVKG